MEEEAQICTFSTLKLHTLMIFISRYKVRTFAHCASFLEHGGVLVLYAVKILKLIYYKIRSGNLSSY